MIWHAVALVVAMSIVGIRLTELALIPVRVVFALILPGHEIPFGLNKFLSFVADVGSTIVLGVTVADLSVGASIGCGVLIALTGATAKQGAFNEAHDDPYGIA